MNWLCLRGLGREKVHWYDFPQAFEAGLPGHKFFALDLPGVGSARSEGAPGTVEGNCESLRKRWMRIRSERGEGAEWGILGMSVGGMAALHWAGDWQPGDFLRAIVINSSDHDSGSVTERLRQQAWPRFLQILAAKDAPSRERRVLRMTTAMLAPARIREIAYRGAELAPREVSKWAALQQIRAGARFQGPAHFDVPLLLLASRGDRVVHPACSERLAERYGARLAVHPTAGHDIPLDDPAWVIDQVRTWLQTSE